VIAKTILDEIGGSIDVTERAGGGAKFSVRLRTAD